MPPAHGEFDLSDKRLIADRDAFGPPRFPGHGVTADPFLDALLVMLTEGCEVGAAEVFQGGFEVQETVALPLPQPFLVAAPAPLNGVCDDAGTDHVQLDIGHAALGV